ncbi:TetR/AcrR family transcriptional regulator [Paenibacillus periandrae]|uniref:TetR/AcrR family transcriptional regulator n=1 Tax=Paenibacillus periandrae TaxID=1761741 RepID=UPI001F08E23A|nr:TetR/AcrR family transcriptional regulator [Paenibacillus periandrae]
MSKSSTRDRIIDTALAIFSEKGYEAASTRDIAGRAGVNEVTLFRHFRNKENLFSEVLNAKFPTSLLSDEVNHRLTGRLREDLTFLAQNYLEIHLKNLDFIRIGLMEVPHNPTCASIVRTIPERLEEHLANYLLDLAARHVIRDANFKLLARMFYGQLFQHVMLICSFGDDSGTLKAERDELINTLVAMYVQTLV